MDGKNLTRAQSAVEYLTTYGWAILIIAIVLAALYSLGVLNPDTFVNTSCVFPAEFSCGNAYLYASTGNIVFSISQDTISNINITAVGCNNLGNTANMLTANSLGLPANVLLTIGGNYTFQVPCYQNYTKLMTTGIQPDQIFKGYIIVNYTSLNSNFPHTIQGQLIAKAS